MIVYLSATASNLSGLNVPSVSMYKHFPSAPPWSMGSWKQTVNVQIHVTVYDWTIDSEVYTIINNNYLLKSRGIAAEYLASREAVRLNILPLSPRLKSIIVLVYTQAVISTTLFCGLLCVFWYSIFLDFQYFCFTNGGKTRVYTGHFVLFGSCIIHPLGSE